MSQEGILMDKSKVKAVTEGPIPTTYFPWIAQFLQEVPKRFQYECSSPFQRSSKKVPESQRPSPLLPNYKTLTLTGHSQ